MILVRNYRPGDAPAITRLFYETVHSVNLKDYSEEQVRAWAPEVPDPEIWHCRMMQCYTLVAEENDRVIGFAELETSGHLDMLYCRSDVIGRGIGRQLYRAIEAKAITLGLRHLFTEASITAHPFFERCGFRVLDQQIVTRHGIELTNFRMEKLF